MGKVLVVSLLTLNHFSVLITMNLLGYIDREKGINPKNFIPLLHALKKNPGLMQNRNFQGIYKLQHSIQGTPAKLELHIPDCSVRYMNQCGTCYVDRGWYGQQGLWYQVDLYGDSRIGRVGFAGWQGLTCLVLHYPRPKRISTVSIFVRLCSREIHLEKLSVSIEILQTVTLQKVLG